MFNQGPDQAPGFFLFSLILVIFNSIYSFTYIYSKNKKMFVSKVEEKGCAYRSRSVQWLARWLC